MENPLNISVTKVAENSVEVSWQEFKLRNTGNSMSLRFQAEKDFLDFCDIFAKAKEIYLTKIK